MQVDFGDDFPEGKLALTGWLADKLVKQAQRLAPFVWLWTWPLVVVMAPWALRVSRRSMWMVGCGAVAFMASAPTRYLFIHYLAPCVPAMILLQSQGFRRLSLVTIRRARVGRWAVMLVLAGMAGWAALALVRQVRHTEFRYWHHQRVEMIDRLAAQGGKHLVIVRLPPDWNKNQYWAYNGADIDGSPVVLARNLTPEKNAALVRYFADRAAWYCDVPSTAKTPYAAPVLTPYHERVSP